MMVWNILSTLMIVLFEDRIRPAEMSPLSVGVLSNYHRCIGCCHRSPMPSCLSVATGVFVHMTDIYDIDINRRGFSFIDVDYSLSLSLFHSRLMSRLIT